MPVDDRSVILPRTTGDTFVSIARGLLSESCKSGLLLIFCLNRHVHVGNLKVHLRDELNTSNLGDDGKDLGTAPCVIDEWSITEASQMLIMMCRIEGELTLRHSLSADPSQGYYCTDSFRKPPGEESLHASA